MSEELEPIAGDVVEPTAVYGPDDWRPYAGHLDLRRVLDEILYGIGREERRKAYDRPVGIWLDSAEPGERASFRYDPFAAAEYSDPQNVREPARTPDEYAYTGHYIAPALRAAQARLAFGILDPKDITRDVGEA